jgi:RNA polymerase sigma-70 factor (ECF subfamily)
MSDFHPWCSRIPADGSPKAEPADSDLVRQMQVGEESALEGLYARYGGLIFTLALRIVGDPELAREVLQDTFLRCWGGREAYDPARGRVPGWLMGIARNRAIDLLRSRPHQARLREEPLAGLASEPAQRDATDFVTLRRAVASALQALPIRQRQAIELAYYAGHTQVEIARELGEPLGTIKSRTREAMERLRAVLWPLIEPTRGG